MNLGDLVTSGHAITGWNELHVDVEHGNYPMRIESNTIGVFVQNATQHFKLSYQSPYCRILFSNGRCCWVHFMEIKVVE